MTIKYELGYTPTNLKLIRKRYGLTQQHVAEITDTANYRSVVKWETELSSNSQRADMPLRKWVMLLDAVKATY